MRNSVAARRSRMSACGLCDCQGSVSNAGSVATPPRVLGKMVEKKRSVSASASARRFESVTKKAGRRSSCAMYAATTAFATSCKPASEICWPPARNAAIAPSIDGWRSTLSRRSRTAGRIIREKSGFCARRRNAVAYFLQDFRGGVAGHDGHRHDAAARRLHFFAANNLVSRPVATLDENVGKQSGDDALRRQIVEDHDGVNALQRGENFRAFALRNHRAPLAFELIDAGVAVQADDERVAEAARLLQAADVARMQQIKAAVGEDDAASIAFPAAKPQNRLLQCEDGIQRVSVRGQPEQIVKPEVVVYHAGVLRRAAQGAPVVG